MSKTLKDQRRADLIIPYVPTEPKAEENDITSTIGSTLPMAAMFTRNKMIGWTAVVFAIQGWLSETPGQVASGKQPAYFSVGMSVMALAMSYLPLFIPSMGKAASSTAPAPPAPAA
ncbi:uncharacterized protein LAJ45_08531 [Morchella importuna]|uniref:Uncharacterized protein n=1 Tax=Morchella conica CCBAS932 TaxID=1392247 RepID=A0A3N4KL31_9PEZI|nr:uncharacterized protein LAJ45_08531 [Morchella importuna]KAH8147375.1 hypothetical protein LAJ45_08531 [Morchella importuna]RPB11240.1 hypothetical protein P167DRAFT_536969 [Morchella conica CCBAS932]